MKKNNNKISSASSTTILVTDLEAYRKELYTCMKRMGASESEIALIHENTIKNSITRNRKPEDVAWAILQ